MTKRIQPGASLQQLLTDAINDLLAQNCTGIEEELRASAEGTLSVSVPIRLTLIGTKVSASIGMLYSRKFKDEVEAVGELPDPNQPELLQK